MNQKPFNTQQSKKESDLTSLSSIDSAIPKILCSPVWSACHDQNHPQLLYDHSLPDQITA